MLTDRPKAVAAMPITRAANRRREPFHLILHPARFAVTRDLHGLGAPLLAGTLVHLDRIGPGPYATVSRNGQWWCLRMAELREGGARC